MHSYLHKKIYPCKKWVLHCHLLLGRPWHYDLNATHSGCSNHYSFVHKGVSHVLKPMKESVIKAEVFATVKRRKPAKTIPKLRTTLFQGEENDVAIVGSDFKANCNKKVAKTMSDLIGISAKPRIALIQGRENNEPINHQFHSTTYVEDFDNISVAKSKKKILLGANLSKNENKIDVTSCVMIGSILLKIKEPKDHVMVPQGFPRVQDTFLSISTRPQVHPIKKSQGMESPSPVQVQLGIQEQSTSKLMPKSHTTSNYGIIGLFRKIRSLLSNGTSLISN
jgi:hypothetical protein